MVSLLGFQKRFCSRVIRDLPADLEATKCEDPLGILRHHVPRLIDRIARDGGERRPAYTHRASFAIPGSPASSRLRSSEGHIPFHFAKNVVEGRTAQGFDAYARGKGRAVEPVEQGSAQEIEAGIDGAAKDAYLRGHGGRDGAPADGWTNLEDPSHWDAIEAFERDRRPNPDGNPPGISIFYDRAPQLFDDIARLPDCPAGLCRLIGKEQARVATGRALSDRKARDGVRWIDKRAFDIYAWIKTQPHWPDRVDKDTRPVRVSGGRAVQTHLAGEGEYHAALEQAARARIRAGMIDLVQRQRNPGRNPDAGWFVPMTICDHVPDGLNDPLNDHFHWLIGTRRARYTGDGDLEFEPNKVNAITRDGWIDTMREELARLTNVELAAIGADVRYHPGTLAEMGIDAPAQQKMHGRRTVIERAGISTERGLSNDTEAWRRAFAAAAADHDAALATIDRDLSAADVRLEPARTARIEAADLRHEAAQIAILIDMSRSRSERTIRFAPEYAARASSPRAVTGWLTRGGEAERHLQALDAELKSERDGVTDRLARAERMEAEETALLAGGAAAKVARQDDIARASDDTIVPRAADTHRAVDIIARAPLFIDDIDGRLVVAPRDDPDALVLGVDLAGVQRRLAGIRAAQQRELAQVQAFARRHGANAVFDEACDTHSPWFQGTLRKWRDTPVMQRYLAEREAFFADGRRADAGERQIHRGRRTEGFGDVADLDDLPSLAELPFLADLAGNAGRAPDHGELRDEPDSADPAKATPASTPPARDLTPVPLLPPTPTLVWNEWEQQHRSLVAWRDQRDRQDTARAIARALTDRVGDGRAITPYAARLIEKVGKGFDPAKVHDRPGIHGRSLDQRDAAEIAVLSRDPGFRAHLDAARRQDVAVARLVAAAPPDSIGPDFLGRVAVERDRLRFGPAEPEQQGPWRTPLEWAEGTMKLVIEGQMPLTRRDGLIGVHDRDVLHLSQYNYLGLLHPAIQQALEVQFRIQSEVERDILAKLRTGGLKIEASIEQDRWSHAVATRVQLVGGTPDMAAFVAQRRSDPHFYFRCREAAAGVPPDAPALRHDNAVVRAWLAAREEGASQLVIDMLGQEVGKARDSVSTTGMTDADARAFTRLLSPPPVMPSYRPKRGRGLRNRLPHYPGRQGPAR